LNGPPRSARGAAGAVALPSEASFGRLEASILLATSVPCLVIRMHAERLIACVGLAATLGPFDIYLQGLENLQGLEQVYQLRNKQRSGLEYMWHCRTSAWCW